MSRITAVETSSPATAQAEMDDAARIDALLRFGRGVADPLRLQIVGLLAVVDNDPPAEVEFENNSTILEQTKIIETTGEAGLTIEDIATRLHSPVQQLNRHMDVLLEAGLIRPVAFRYPPRPGMEPVPWRWRLDLTPFQNGNIARALSVIDRSMTDRHGHIAIDPNDPDAERQKTLATFFTKEGKLASMPVKAARIHWVIEAIAERFEVGRRYTEKEVNAILEDIYEYDYATIRRNLIDFGLMKREDMIYWRV